MITLSQIEEVLEEFNAAERYEVKYSTQYYVPCIKQYVYINKQCGSRPSGLVIHPRFENKLDELLSMSGVDSTRELNHKSSMRKFPKRLNRGKDPIPFGLPFGFDSKEALRKFILRLTETKPYYVRNSENEISEAEASGEFSDLDSTTIDRIVSSRRGQGKYRKDLIRLWGKCAITECKQVELLRASHIKPWRDSSNSERLDPHNGLLLTPNYDLLFDIGMITFDSKGAINISPSLDEETLETLGVSYEARLTEVRSESEKYLKYHRKHIYQER